MKQSPMNIDEEIPPSSIDVHRPWHSTKAPIMLECRVCAAPAHGFNFDQITCESCKAFFRRNALKPTVNSHSPLRLTYIRVVFSRTSIVDSRARVRFPWKLVVNALLVD